MTGIVLGLACLAVAGIISAYIEMAYRRPSVPRYRGQHRRPTHG